MVDAVGGGGGGDGGGGDGGGGEGAPHVRLAGMRVAVTPYRHSKPWNERG